VTSERVNIARFPRENNIQWLRIIFAVQVAIVHGVDRLWHYNVQFLRYIPGVPAFFFVSGFLIYSSWINSPGLSYFQNRFLRLWPALIFVTCGGFATALYVRGAGDLLAHRGTYLVWLFGQITLGQWYNPEIFRNVGVGVINAALWTITTEIIFYLCVPAIAYFERFVKHSVLIISALSFGLYLVGPHFLTINLYRDKTLYEMLAITPLVWGWMFGAGILAVKYYAEIKPYLRYLPFALVVMIALIIYGKFDDGIFGCGGNRLGILYFIPYCAMIMYFSFGLPFVRLDTDLSYGMYIWHMPVLNVLIILGIASPLVFLPAVFCMGLISWFVIERPCLRLKRRTIHKV